MEKKKKKSRRLADTATRSIFANRRIVGQRYEDERFLYGPGVFVSFFFFFFSLPIGMFFFIFQCKNENSSLVDKVKNSFLNPILREVSSNNSTLAS